MNRFSLKDSNPGAWLLLSFSKQQGYLGNLGYADETSKLYKYDSFVQNHRQISKGDLAVLRNEDELLGVARIEQTKDTKGEKRLY